LPIYQVDRRARVRDVLDPLSEVSLQTVTLQFPDSRRRRRWQPAPVRLPLENSGQRLGERLPAEDRLSGEHLVQDATERPHVGACVDGKTTRLLGAHVRGG